MRSPYGRRGVYGTMARLFAERGYHAVVQSTRGTFGSEGHIDFDLEATDGRAAADWIVEQPWSNGDLGTFGGSYLGFTQLALASTRPPQLKAMALAVWAAERRAYAYPGGAFSLDRLGWAVVMANQERPFSFVRAALRARSSRGRPEFDHLPLISADTAAVGHPIAFYRDWVTHDQPGDPYWTPTDFRPILPDLGVPVTMLAGWYDMFLPSMLKDYQALRDGGQTVRLRVGAWHHTSQDLFRHEFADALDWFATHLRGQQPAQRTRVPGQSVPDPGRDHGRRRLARAPDVAAAGRRPALASSPRRRPVDRGARAIRPRPLHLRSRRSHPRRRRHQHDQLRPAGQPRARQRPDVLTYTTKPLTERSRSSARSRRNCSSAPAGRTPISSSACATSTRRPRRSISPTASSA